MRREGDFWGSVTGKTAALFFVCVIGVVAVANLFSSINLLSFLSIEQD